MPLPLVTTILTGNERNYKNRTNFPIRVRLVNTPPLIAHALVPYWRILKASEVCGEFLVQLFYSESFFEPLWS